MSVNMYDLGYCRALAEVFVRAGVVRGERGAPVPVEAVMARLLYGHDLGFSPSAALTEVQMVKGNLTLSANALAVLVRRAGYDYVVDRLEDDVAVLRFLGRVRPDGTRPELGVSTFSSQDARRAGLDTEIWRQYPRNMLFARAMSNGVAWYCPEVAGGSRAYVPEEMGDVEAPPPDIPAEWAGGYGTGSLPAAPVQDQPGQEEGQPVSLADLDPAEPRVPFGPFAGMTPSQIEDPADLQDLLRTFGTTERLNGRYGQRNRVLVQAIAQRLDDLRRGGRTAPAVSPPPVHPPAGLAAPPVRPGELEGPFGAAWASNERFRSWLAARLGERGLDTGVLARAFGVAPTSDGLASIDVPLAEVVADLDQYAEQVMAEDQQQDDAEENLWAARMAAAGGSAR